MGATTRDPNVDIPVESDTPPSCQRTGSIWGREGHRSSRQLGLGRRRCDLKPVIDNGDSRGRGRESTRCRTAQVQRIARTSIQKGWLHHVDLVE